MNQSNLSMDESKFEKALDSAIDKLEPTPPPTKKKKRVR